MFRSKKFFSMNKLIPKTIYTILIFISCSSRGNREYKSTDTLASSPKEVPAYVLSLKLVASDLEGPIGTAVPNDGTNRLFVIEQEGRIRVIKDGKLLPQSFLDITSITDHGSSFYSEKGLLG